MNAMERRIIGIMVTLVVVAAVVVAFVMIAAGGGWRSAGGFTDLFDDLVYTGNATTNQMLSLPSGWSQGDKKVVSDVITDMVYRKQPVSQTTVYITTVYFVYLGNKWSNPYQGSGQNFNVPVTYGNFWLHVDHGQFSITVSSATNVSADYSIGDVITVESTLKLNGLGQLAFDTWNVKGVL